MEDLSLNKFDYEKLVHTIKKISGINLITDKEAMVKSRLLKRLLKLNFRSFSEYIHYYENDKSALEIQKIVELLTTNKTNFFREKQHFNFIEKELIPLMKSHPYRIWSAGCSSGEEPYSLAMLLHNKMSEAENINTRILATDISSRMLEIAREGNYDPEGIKDIPETFLKKYFKCIKDKSDTQYQLIKEIKKKVSFARLNLMQSWPMKESFDLILCRNVMIYFDKDTRETLINRFWGMLKDGGYLFVGHSENLTGITTSFKYMEPAIYKKDEAVLRKKVNI